MRIIGAILLICGFCTAFGYFLYVVMESTPTALKVAIIIIVLGFIVMMASLIRERYRTSKEEDFKEVDR